MTTSGWISASEAADYLGVTPEWVREHAGQLGGHRLGAGPRPRLRFRRDLLDQALSPCEHGRRTPFEEPPNHAPRRRNGRPGMGTSVPLLPIHRSGGGG